MKASETINELAAALAKAQAQIQGAIKDSANPFFKSKYADLASVWDAIRVPLSSNGLSVVQGPDVLFREDSTVHVLKTRLMHASGQWVESMGVLNPVKDDPQGMGSAITYQRRYQLQAIAGVAPEDDDGNAASARQTPKFTPINPSGPEDFRIGFGQFKGKLMREVDGIELDKYAEYLRNGRAEQQGKPTYRPIPQVDAFLDAYERLIGKDHAHGQGASGNNGAQKNKTGARQNPKTPGPTRAGPGEDIGGSDAGGFPF